MKLLSKKNKFSIALQLSFITALFFNGAELSADVIPAHSSVLHYTNVYFETDLLTGIKEYEFFLYKDSVNARKHIFIRTAKNKLPAFRVADLEWGQTYWWTIVPRLKNGLNLDSANLHVFSIQNVVYQSFDAIKLDVKTNKKSKNAGGFICIDYTRSIYDRDGKRVWTMPFIDNLVDESTQIRDMKLTNDNTLTFLTIPIPGEMDLQGKLIWRAPFPYSFKNDTVVFHHQLRKTQRGTYMIMGDKKVWRKVEGSYAPADLKTEFETKVIDNVVYKRVLIAIMLEFNKEGRLIWSWDANNYVTDADLSYKKTKRGFPNLATHANAFGESADGSKVYIGFRDLSRIVKIDKATGKVELTYGEKYPSGDAVFANNLFLNQHDAYVTKHNSILIFNNNGALAPVGVSSIVELKDNVTKKDSVLLWKFDLNFDTLSNGKSMNGGNVNEMPNGNILLCAGSMNRIFEVTRAKEIVWDAFLFARGKEDTTWQPMPQYRCSWTKQINDPHAILSIAPIKTKGSTHNLNLTIYNTGNCDDNYSVDIFGKEGQLIKNLTLGNVKKDASFSAAFVLTSPETPAYCVIRSKKYIYEFRQEI